MTKEEISELIKEAASRLIQTDIIVYPAGSMRREDINKIGSRCEYHPLVEDKPEFLDIQDYRKLLLELISKLIDFYKEV